MLAADVGLATPADVYSTYSFLHAKGRRTQVVCNSEGTLLYLVVVPDAEVTWLDLNGTTPQLTGHTCAVAEQQGSCRRQHCPGCGSASQCSLSSPDTSTPKQPFESQPRRACLYCTGSYRW